MSIPSALDEWLMITSTGPDCGDVLDALRPDARQGAEHEAEDEAGESRQRTEDA